jgi:hypothetical protein
LKADTIMAYKTVQFIIGRILTDEELREKFLVSPAETLTYLRDEMGFDLTNAEIDAIARTDLQLWEAGPHWIDARLQRCSLTRQQPIAGAASRRK